MAYDFVRLADVEALSEVPENATVLAEVNGAIKRVPGNGLGGSGNGIVLVMDDASAQTFSSAPVFYTFTANMDFADAMEAFNNREITSVAVYGLASVMGLNTLGQAHDYYVMGIAYIADVASMVGTDCLGIFTTNGQMPIYWTASGISTEEPSSPK